MEQGTWTQTHVWTGRDYQYVRQALMRCRMAANGDTSTPKVTEVVDFAIGQASIALRRATTTEETT